MVWVPPTVARELVEKRVEYSMQLRDLLYFEGGILDDWNAELKKIDPYLRLAQAVEKVPAGFPLRPGFYHIVRLNPDAPPTTNYISGPNDEFVEPSQDMLERLKRSDLQNAAVQRLRRQEKAAEEQAREKAKETETAERREEITERWMAATRTQVLTSDDIPYSQNVSGRRGARRDS